MAALWRAQRHWVGVVLLAHRLSGTSGVGTSGYATEIASGVGERMERLEDRMARLEELLLELRDR